MADKEIERYADGTEIKRFPRWVYPGGKPSVNPSNKNEHNGKLVNDQKELDALIKTNPEFGETAKNDKGGWAK